MPLSYDDSDTPKDLRQMEDHEIQYWAQSTSGALAAALREVQRLRKLTAKLLTK